MRHYEMQWNCMRQNEIARDMRHYEEENGQRKQEDGEKGKGGVKMGQERKTNKAELIFPESV